jgi:hypothetical protein
MHEIEDPGHPKVDYKDMPAVADVLAGVDQAQGATSEGHVPSPADLAAELYALRLLAEAVRVDLTGVPRLARSARTPGGTPYATEADYATYAAARMNASGGMTDTEAVAEGGTLIIKVHQDAVLRAQFTCTVPGCAQHREDLFDGYTREQLQAAFKQLPLHPEGWKMPIRGFVPADSDIKAMSAAIGFYCGSPSDFTAQPDGRFYVDAPGYYTCVG